MSLGTKKFVITRFDPDRDTEPRTEEYEIPVQSDWKVLDAINFIKDEIDGSLSYRWSCRMAVCGSCGMMVNGEPKLTCKTALSSYGDSLTIEPLANFPTIRDLVVEMDGFMDKFQKVKPWITQAKERAVEEGPQHQSPEDLQAFKQFSMCINCMLCYSACPVVATDPEFLGPAAIALGHRYNMDSRDEGQDQRAEIIGSHEGIWGCTFVGECTRVCPKHVDPAAAIQRSKVQLTKEYFLSWIWPRGKR